MMPFSSARSAHEGGVRYPQTSNTDSVIPHDHSPQDAYSSADESSKPSRRSLTVRTKRVAWSPSLMRWSKDMPRFMMGRIAIASVSTTTGRLPPIYMVMLGADHGVM